MISQDSELCCLLVDNGSKRPEATLSLRRVAASLSEWVGDRIEPVSLLHSSGIDPAKLDGVPAEIFEPFVNRQAKERGRRRFLVIPLFFGPSGAIVEYLPQRVAAMQQNWPGLEVRVAPWLVDEHNPSDDRIARILLDLVECKAREEKLARPAVAVVDHGTPQCQVNLVRNLVAAQLRKLAGDRFSRVEVCSMEKRDDPEVGFNDPLLEKLLGDRGFDREVVLSMLFISPGRHAGPDGDVAEICREAEETHPGLKVFVTDLVASHPGLVELLADRMAAGME